MIIDYGSAAYFSPFLITALAVAALYFAFRGRTAHTKRAVVLVLAAQGFLGNIIYAVVFPVQRALLWPVRALWG